MRTYVGFGSRPQPISAQDCQSASVLGQLSAEISVNIAHPRPEQYSDNYCALSVSWWADFHGMV